MKRRIPFLLLCASAFACNGPLSQGPADPDSSAALPGSPTQDGTPAIDSGGAHAPATDPASEPPQSSPIAAPVGGPSQPVAPGFARVYHVSLSGSDSNSGAEAAPLRTINRAIRLLRPGEAAFVHAGTYVERLELAELARNGESDRPITLRAAPGELVVLKGGTGSSKALISLSRAYWHIEGLELDVAGDHAMAVMFRGVGAHHDELRGCDLHGGTGGAGVTLSESASYLLLENNRIHHFANPHADSHGVAVETNARHAVLRGNDIHHNSADGVQCTGPEWGGSAPGTPFDDLLVDNNKLHENGENGADIKTCTHVTLRNNQVWGHHRSPTSGGEGIVIHVAARAIRVEGNRLWDNGRGISVGGLRFLDPPTDITLVHNRIWGGYNKGGEDGVGIRVNTARQVRIWNNTIYGQPGAGLMAGYGDTGDSDTVEFKNNVVAECTPLLRVGPSRSHLTFERNLYFRTGGTQYLLSGVRRSLYNWHIATGLDGTSLEGAPQLADPAKLDFTLAAGSPARDSGLDLGLPFCGAAPDLGALESGCP